jgi:hypothetical protein
MGKSVKKAKVKKVLDDSRVMVTTESGELGTIQQEVFAPGVPLSWIFADEMALVGDWDPANRTYLPHQTAKNVDDVARLFGLGNVTLGLVQVATRKTAEVAIMPGVVFEMTKPEITGNPLDVISSYLDVGDVIPVRIYRNPEGKIRLRMDDIDDDEKVIEALPIFQGGTPWLEEGRDVPWLKTVDEPVTEQLEVVAEPAVADAAEPETANVPVPRPGLHSARPSGKAEASLVQERNEALYAAKHAANAQRRFEEENARLRKERLESDQTVAKYKEKLSAHVGEIADLRQQLAEARKQKRAQQSSRSTTTSRRDRWASDQGWFNEELRRAWIGRYKPADREEKYPLNFERFGYADGFFASIKGENISEDEIKKTVRVMLDIATGRNAVEHIHTVHEKFIKLGGQQESRSDGALLWRVHLEKDVPAAKRLHYWLRKDGFIDFGWIANHDDDL